MRRVFAFALVVSLSGAGSAFAAGAQAPKPSTVSGTANSSTGSPLANTTVRLRQVNTGSISATSTSSATGQFTMTVANPGEYVVEVVDAAGNVIGTSAVITVAPGAASSVTITGTAVQIAKAASKPFFTSAAGIVTAAATAAGVVGVTVAATQGSASPSK